MHTSASVLELTMVNKTLFFLFFFCDFVYSNNPKTVVMPVYKYQNTPAYNFLELIERSATLRSLTTSYSPDEQNIYYLFTRNHVTRGYPLILGNRALLAASDFDPRKRTAVIIHGWMGSVMATLNAVLMPAYLQAADVNVLVVDWSAGSSGNYFTAVINTVPSGESVARFIKWLNYLTGATPGSYHVLGHSLGGQQAGVIGRNVGGIGYITALDPANPLWVLNPHRLKPEDSLYTEVIHTNAGFAGYLDTLGHVDFYPNGGLHMTGCDGQSCDHDRCFHYMAESIVEGGFQSVDCSNIVSLMMGQCNGSRSLNMGGIWPKMGMRGMYYLKTNGLRPFSIR